jgi:hypothetical protein
MFEKYGPGVVRAALVTSPTGNLNVQLELRTLSESASMRDAALEWLTEQAHKEEQRHNVTLLLEIFILAFVGVEMVVSLVDLYSRLCCNR